MFKYIQANSIGEGIEQALQVLNKEGIIQIRENQDKSDETKEIQLCLDIANPTHEPFISRCIITDLKGLAKYDHEFLEGSSDNLGWKYTYHQLYSKYYTKVIEELKRNIHSRRACIALGQGDLNFSEDPPCMQLLMFNYINDKLEMTIVFRSNDGVKAFPMNIHACSMLQLKIAKELNLQCGALHYIANNFHCYSKDYVLLEKYCNIFNTNNLKRRFSSYKDLMEVY